MMVIENKFQLFQTVYLITDEDQKQRIVTAVGVYPTGLLYRLAQGANESWHYELEISEEINVLTKVKSE